MSMCVLSIAMTQGRSMSMPAFFIKDHMYICNSDLCGYHRHRTMLVVQEMDPLLRGKNSSRLD
jgi:hypothetical protein